MSTTVNKANLVPISYTAPTPTHLPSLAVRCAEKIRSLMFAPARFIIGCIALPASLPTAFPTWLSSRIGYSEKVFRAELQQKREYATHHHQGERITIQTHDSALIDGMVFRGKEKKGILFLGGNGCFYESTYDRFLLIKGAVGDVTALTINPRSVGESQGSCDAEKLGFDVFASFKYLVDIEGIDPSDIVIYGWSLGSGYGARGAELIQREYPTAKINFVSDRSFAHLTDVAHHSLLGAPQIGALHKIKKWAIEKLIRWTKWDMNAVSALDQLKGKKCVILNPKDNIIPHATSLHEILKEQGKLRGFSEVILNPHLEQPHLRDFTCSELREIGVHIQQMLCR